MSVSESPERTIAPAPTEQAIPVTVRLLTDSQFEEPLSSLMSFLGRSLDVRNDAEELVDLQAGMMSFLLGAQDSQKQIQRELDDAAIADKQHYSSPGTVIEVCKRLQRIVRQIADGIAWRSMAYDRAVLRILAQKPHTGHMERSSAEEELLAAAAHAVKSGELVVINDLTNYLRYGDFTAIGENGVKIYEVKGGQGSAQSGHSSRQKRKTNEVLEFIRRGYTSTAEGPRRIVNLKTKPVAHMSELHGLVSEAKNSGFGFARLSDSLAVVVLDAIDMGEKVDAGKKISDLVRNPFEQSKHAAVYDSLAFSSRFSWNLAPYSVFPLPPEDRLAIMTGKLWVVTFFNYGNLYRCLRRRNLRVRPPTEEGYAALDGLPPREVAKRELDNPLIVSRIGSNWVYKIPVSSLSRLFFELMDEESYADAVEEELDLVEAESQPTLIDISYLAEAELWD